jgi:hypothetical protein
MSGIFISKGTTITIPIGGLSIFFGGEGAPKTDIKVHVVFDVCPSWLEIALDHLSVAKTCNVARNAAWESNDGDAKGATLEREFKASMQAIVAAATAIESFYATTRKKINIDEALAMKWREKKIARYSQVCEVLRLAFQLKPENLKILRGILKQIYQFRAYAVHPSSSPTEAVLHPELKVGVEWRFVAFRYENVLPLVRATMEIIGQLVTDGKSANEEVKKYADFLKPQLDTFRGNEIFADWALPS